MATPILMREIIATLARAGTPLVTRVGSRIYGAPADGYDAEQPGIVIVLIGGSSNAHSPVWTPRTEIWSYGGRTGSDKRADQASATYALVCDRLRDVEMFVTSNAVVMDVVEVTTEELTVDPTRGVPVSLSVWDWQIRPNS